MNALHPTSIVTKPACAITVGFSANRNSPPSAPAVPINWRPQTNTSAASMVATSISGSRARSRFRSKSPVTRILLPTIHWYSGFPFNNSRVGRALRQARSRKHQTQTAQFFQ